MMKSSEEQAPFFQGGSAGAACAALHALATSCDYDGKKLARMFNISQRQLQRMFSAELARSPQSWLNEQRLLAARDMLKTAHSIKEVAYTLGFRRTSQFSRDFRRMFGFTPSEACQDIHPDSVMPGISSRNLAAMMRSERQRGHRPGRV